jgi:hypothetical protein
MSLISSYQIGPEQADQKAWVSETHVAPDGQVYKYEWLHDGTLDPQLVLEARAKKIEGTIAARAAALAAVVGTSVPISRYEFKIRMTPEERKAIRRRAKINEDVEDFLDLLNTSGIVFLSLARPYLQQLALLGDITAERAAVIGAE